jgi:hypothetical protein
MESKLAQEVERALIESVRQWTAEQRLNAFLAHCRLMAELYRADEKKAPIPCQRIFVRAKGPGESALLLLDAVTKNLQD